MSPARRYIVGEESNLGVTTTEPRVHTPNTTYKHKTASWPASTLSPESGNWAFRVVRGHLEEFKTRGWSVGGFQTRVFARVLPDDAVPALDALDAQIEETIQLLKRLRQERQEMLAAIVPRAQRVKVP